MEKFSYEANGYNRNEVNNFVGDVITQTEGIIQKCKEQREEIRKLKEELKHYREIENSLKDAVMRAEMAGDNIKKILNELFYNPDKMQEMKIRARLISKKNSTKDICKILLG